MNSRKIKFALKMKNGKDVRCIEELRENADVESILKYYYDGRLLRWCKGHDVDFEVKKFKKLNAKNIKMIFDSLQIQVTEIEINEYLDSLKNKVEENESTESQENVKKEIVDKNNSECEYETKDVISSGDSFIETNIQNSPLGVACTQTSELVNCSSFSSVNAVSIIPNVYMKTQKDNANTFDEFLKKIESNRKKQEEIYNSVIALQGCNYNFKNLALTNIKSISDNSDPWNKLMTNNSISRALDQLEKMNDITFEEKIELKKSIDPQNKQLYDAILRMKNIHR